MKSIRSRMIDIAAIKVRFETLSPYLDERARRLFAAAEAQAAGWGGVTAVCAATGVARSTIGRGLAELRSADACSRGRIRRLGGGRKPKAETEPGLLETLKEIVESAIRGDPEAFLLWVSRSQRHLVCALAERGFTATHPDRDMQFEHINAKIKQFRDGNQPVISVDTKKKGVPQRHGKELIMS